jgi:hypothetical protein
MVQTLERVSDSVIDALFKAIESPSQQAENKLSGSGSIPFVGWLDENGNYNQSESKWCAGITINYTAIIESPEGIFNTIEIRSSAGSDNKYSNVKTGQNIQGQLKTKFFDKTTISVSVHSDTLKDVEVTGKLSFSY